MNQLEKLGLIMIKCIENAVHEGGSIDKGHIDVYPNLTDEEWSEVEGVMHDVA